MRTERVLVRVALAAGVVWMLGMAACLTVDWPETVKGGNPGEGAGGGSVAPTSDAAIEEGGEPDAPDLGPATTCSYTYTSAGASYNRCAIEYGAVDASAVGPTCTNAAPTGRGGTLGTSCSPLTLSGCCILQTTPTLTFGTPSGTCFYGETDYYATQVGCESIGGATWYDAFPP